MSKTSRRCTRFREREFSSEHPGSPAALSFAYHIAFSPMSNDLPIKFIGNLARYKTLGYRFRVGMKPERSMGFIPLSVRGGKGEENHPKMQRFPLCDEDRARHLKAVYGAIDGRKKGGGKEGGHAVALISADPI